MGRVAGTLALFLGSTLVGLAIVEGYLRWSGAFEAPAVPGCYVFSDNPRLMYELAPNCGDTNSLGIRDHPLDPSAPGDRIVAVGDSITYGPDVGLDEAWPKQLERMLRRTRRATSVLNFAVQGYSTVQEVETLRTKALPLRPRVALLQYCFNDQEIYTTIFDGMVADAQARQGNAVPEALDPRHGWLVRKLLLSRTVIALKLALARWWPESGPTSPHDNAITAYYHDHDPVRAGLEALREISRTHGLPALVLLFPHAYGARADHVGHFPLPELSEYPNTWVFDTTHVRGVCADLGMDCIDMAGRFHDDPHLRRIPGHRLFTDGCCHLRALGHKAMAWVVFRELAARGLLDPSARPVVAPAPGTS